LVCSLLPDLTQLLEYDRDHVSLDGEWWRILSGQLVHWNARMAILDLGIVTLLGLWAARMVPWMTRGVLLAGVPAIGIGIHLWSPQILTYRGSSGLASALFVLVALVLASEPNSRVQRALAILALVLLGSKIGVETWTGAAVFAGPLPDGVRVTPFAHLLGAGVALGVFLAERGLRCAIGRARR